MRFNSKKHIAISSMDDPCNYKPLVYALSQSSWQAISRRAYEGAFHSILLNVNIENSYKESNVWTISTKNVSLSIDISYFFIYIYISPPPY